MAAEVLVTFKTDTASLSESVNRATKDIESVGSSAEASANKSKQAFAGLGKSIGAAFSSNEVRKSLDSNNKFVTQAKGGLIKLNQEALKTAKSFTTLANGLKQNARQTLEAEQALAGYNESLITTGNDTVQTEEKTKSLKGRLRELKEELSALETAGQDGTEAFTKLSIEAGKLQDQIGDTQERVKVLASDTFKFDAALGAVKGLAAGFAVAQGAAALFGSDSEELNKTIAKTQGALALLTGLQEIANLVTGQGAAKVFVMNTLQKINAASVRQAAVSYDILGTSVKFSARSLNILKGALAATGVGLLVIGLGMLMERFMDSSEEADNFAESARKVTDALNELQIRQSDAVVNLANANIRLKVANGDLSKSAGENIIAFNNRGSAIKAVNDNLKKSEDELLIEFEKAQKEKAKAGKRSDAEIKKDKEDLFAQIKLLNENSQLDIEAINTDARAAAKQKGIDDAKDAAATAQANADKFKEANNKLIEDRLKTELNVLKVIELANGESTQNKIDQANKEAEIEKANAKASITNAKLKASTIELIDAQLAEKVEQIKLDQTTKSIEEEVKVIEAKRIIGTLTVAEEIKVAEKSLEIEKLKLEKQIEANKATAGDLLILNATYEKKIIDIKNKATQEDINLKAQSFELQKLLGDVSLENEINIINARAEAEIRANEDSTNSVLQKEANRLAIIAKTDQAITQAKAVEANKQIDIDNTADQIAVTLKRSTYQQRVGLIEDEGQKQINSLDKKLLGEEAYNSAVLKINANTTAQLDAEQQTRVDKVFEYAEAIVGAFSAINDLSQVNSELRIEQIQSISDKELEAINASTETEGMKQRQRENLEKRTNQKISAEKTKQAKLNKALSIFEIGINTASSIIKTGAQLGYPAAIPFQIGAAIVGAAQIAIVSAQSIPKLEKGGLIGGKLHSSGGTMIEAERGEYIINRKQTSKYKSELNALNNSSEEFRRLINEKYVKPALMNYMLRSKKDSSINVNAMLNSKAMEDEIRGLRKDIRNNSKVFYNNEIDSRYSWQQR